jgi:hypothetical protein
MNNVGNGLLIVNDMMLQRNKPDFRIDENYEDHVLELFSHFAEYAVAQKLSILLTGRSAKNVSIKHALMLASLKGRCNIFVAEFEASSVNPALLEMNCITVLPEGDFMMGDTRVHISGVAPKDNGNYDKIILLNSQPEVLFKTTKGWGSQPIPSSIQRNDGELGHSVEVSKVKPKLVSALFDDSDMIKDDVYEAGITLDFGFIDKLKTLNQRHREIDISEIDDAISPLQQVINGMDLSFAKQQVQSLFDEASEAQEENQQKMDA